MSPTGEGALACVFASLGIPSPASKIPRHLNSLPKRLWIFYLNSQFHIAVCTGVSVTERRARRWAKGQESHGLLDERGYAGGWGAAPQDRISRVSRTERAPVSRWGGRYDLSSPSDSRWKCMHGHWRVRLGPHVNCSGSSSAFLWFQFTMILQSLSFFLLVSMMAKLKNYSFMCVASTNLLLFHWQLDLRW